MHLCRSTFYLVPLSCSFTAILERISNICSLDYSIKVLILVLLKFYNKGITVLLGTNMLLYDLLQRSSSHLHLLLWWAFTLKFSFLTPHCLQADRHTCTRGWQLLDSDLTILSQTCFKVFKNLRHIYQSQKLSWKPVNICTAQFHLSLLNHSVNITAKRVWLSIWTFLRRKNTKLQYQWWGQ